MNGISGLDLLPNNLGSGKNYNANLSIEREVLKKPSA